MAGLFVKNKQKTMMCHFTAFTWLKSKKRVDNKYPEGGGKGLYTLLEGKWNVTTILDSTPAVSQRVKQSYYGPAILLLCFHSKLVRNMTSSFFKVYGCFAHTYVCTTMCLVQGEARNVCVYIYVYTYVCLKIKRGNTAKWRNKNTQTLVFKPHYS